MELIPYADFVFGNEDETLAFGKAMGLEVKDLHEVTTFIAKYEKVGQ